MAQMVYSPDAFNVETMDKARQMSVLAGSEMLRLNRNFTPKVNDSAVQYYRPDERTGRSGGIFSVTK